jgi:hypothetical protein
LGDVLGDIDADLIDQTERTHRHTELSHGVVRVRHLLIVFALAFPLGALIGILMSRGPAADETQARICRAILPALVGETTTITVIRAMRGPEAASVRRRWIEADRSGDRCGRRGGKIELRPSGSPTGLRSARAGWRRVWISSASCCAWSSPTSE